MTILGPFRYGAKMIDLDIVPDAEAMFTALFSVMFAVFGLGFAAANAIVLDCESHGRTSHESCELKWLGTWLALKRATGDGTFE